MAKTIFRTRGGNGFLAGTFQKGFWGDGFGSIRQIVHDGDTVNVSSPGNFPIRFLGIDTPESSLMWPATGGFIGTDKPEFAALLERPLGDDNGPMLGLTQELADHIAARSGAGAAETHHHYAKAAEKALEGLMQLDADEIGNEQYFLAFAYEALDFYGRLLAYVHPSQPDAAPADRRKSYNERMLATGLAAPYFIFPNVDPFRAKGSPLAAAAAAIDPPAILAQSPSLRAAREAVRQARAAGLGVFDDARPNPFEAFELRFLTRRTAPSRWVIDLSKEDKLILHPTSYHRIPRSEDRLWIPAEFVALFEAQGWVREPSPTG